MIDALLDEAVRDHGLRLADGLQVLTRGGILLRAFDPSWPVLLLPDDSEPAAGDGQGSGSVSFRVAVLPGRHARPADALAILRDLYPAEHPAHGLAGTPPTTVGEMSGSSLGSGTYLLPGLEPVANMASPHVLPWIVARLRAPDGCPWDREQTHLSLRPFLLEESYEVYDALEQGSTPQLAEELGDLLLQVVLHAEQAAEAGVFDLTDVYRSIAAKIVRRHPHVFADVRAGSVEQVLRNWEQIKAAERTALASGVAISARDMAAAVASEGQEEARPQPPSRAPASGRAAEGAPSAMPAAFAGLARSLPALAYAQEMQGRAAALGYDWPNVEGVIEKLEEEAVELLEAATDEQRTEEFGDLLLVLVNLARKLGIDAEAALRAGNRKFARRFARVEAYAAERGRPLDAMTFEELDELWDAAKSAERDAAGRGDQEDAG